VDLLLSKTGMRNHVKLRHGFSYRYSLPDAHHHNATAFPATGKRMPQAKPAGSKNKPAPRAGIAKCLSPNQRENQKNGFVSVVLETI
jgi:hypothetical protein